MAIDERKIMNGTHGTVFLDGEEVAELKAFQAKLEFQKEEVKVAGKMATGTKYMGYSGKGSLSLHKVNSRMIKAIGSQIKEANTQSNVFIAISLKVVDAMEDIVVSVEI